jgi:D-3-phosphoglycerate dehydrogenase
MRARVWVTANLHPVALARLQAAAEVVANAGPATLPGVDAVIINSLTLADAGFMDQAGPTLQIIARPGIGVDNIDMAAATQQGILVVNTPDGPTESTAEHAVALLLALAKRVVAGDNSLRGAAIPRPQLLGTEARGRLLGVVGFGRIGRRVAEICAQGLRMRVIAYDPFVVLGQTAVPGVTLVGDLDRLLAEADFVTLHTPLTPATYHLIGERELRLMKPMAYLINASRGPVVDEAALARVLAAGHLAGAALDVFDPEPPLPHNPLFRLPNVIATPHIASFTDLATQAMGMGAVEQVLQALGGERPPFLLNAAAWPGRVL